MRSFLGLVLAIVGSLLVTAAGAQTACVPGGRPISFLDRARLALSSEAA